MSAFTVDQAHIDTLVNAGRQYSGLDIDQAHAERLGQMLWAENVRSVNYRYSEDEWEPIYQATLTDVPLSPMGILGAIHCYEYQACEHPEWEASQAHDYCEALRQAILRQHPEWARKVPSRYDRGRLVYAYTQTPEYEAAPWEVTSLDQVTV